MAQLQLYGADWCADCHAVRSYLEAHGIQYEYRNIDLSDTTKTDMLQLTNGEERIPVLARDGQALAIEPDVRELKRLFTKQEETVMAQTHDVIMIGAGPAALAAAVYTTREDIDTLLFERGVVGGLAAVTDKVDNYPGFPDGIEGLTLADNLRKQAERFGAVIELGEVLGIKDEGEYKRLETTSGDMLARAVLIATGSDYKKLGIPGEQEYYARGVHYCATCDGAFYRDKKLVVVGGGNSAVQEAIFLTRFASHIDLLVRSKFRASDVLQQELKEYVESGKITVHLGTTTDEIVGDPEHMVTKVLATQDGKKVEFETDGVFVFVGLMPNSQFVHGTAVELDEIGFVKTDAHLQTTIPGVFAAGDIRSGATMQIASAVGEGATAALIIREYLEGKLMPVNETTQELAPTPVA